MANEEPLYSLPDNVLQRGIDQGQRTYQRQRYGRPQFGFPDISQDQVDKDRLFNALIGAGMGAQAGGQGLNPLAALAMGAGAGISAPQVGDLRAKRQATQLSLQEEQLNQAPVGAVAPQMVAALQAKYGMDVSEIPMGQFQKFTGLLSRADDLEKQLMLIQARAGAAENKNNLTLEEARLYQKSYNIPAEILVGKDKGVVNQQVIGFRPFQKQAQALLQSEVTINNLKNQWEKLKSEGKIGVKAGLSGKVGQATGGLAGDPDVAAYMRERNSAITGIRKLFNDSGAPSNFDVSRYLDSIPSAFDQPGLAGSQWNFLQQQNEMGRSTIVQASPLTEYLFNRGAQRQQPEQTGATVVMTGPDGRQFNVPANKVEKFRKNGYR